MVHCVPYIKHEHTLHTLLVQWPTDAINVRHIRRQTTTTCVGCRHTMTMLSLTTDLKAFYVLQVFSCKICQQQTPQSLITQL